MAEPARGVRRILYWLLAGLFFVLGMLGVVLPGVPTTPFLLLMCYFLVRVSPALHAKAMAWPVVGGPLRDWQDQGGVRPQVKLLAFAMVVMLVGSTLVWASLSLTVKSLILCAALCGLSVVIRLPTLTPVTSDAAPIARGARAVTIAPRSRTITAQVPKARSLREPMGG